MDSSSLFNPLNQTFYLEGPGNVTVPVWITIVDEYIYEAFSASINYGSQIGACFVMLMVLLTMTSKSRFSRASTIINMVALAIGTIRCTLLALYFTSSYLEFYRFFSGDFSGVSANDTRISNAATFFALPQLVLIEVALFLQAYSMIQLWPSMWKTATLVMSAAIATFAVAFKFTSVVLRIRRTLNATVPLSSMWVYQTDLAFTATTIFWFCFVFIIRIIIHMWEYRSILPPMGGVSAMEVLVMTNGILMLIPVVFAALELGNLTTFEAGSLCYTSVIIVLPLGTLIAQSMTGSRSNRGTGVSGVSGGHMNSNGSGNSGYRGAYSRATSDTNNSKSNFFGTWSHASDATTTVVSGGIASPKSQGGSKAAGGRSGSRFGSVDATSNCDSFIKTKAAIDPVDQELERIDSSIPDGRVRVGREIEVRQDMV